MSPREIAAIEMLSPMAVDVEMESPKVQSEELLPQQQAGTFNCFILKMEMGSLSSPFFTCLPQHNLVAYGTFRLNYCTLNVSLTITTALPVVSSLPILHSSQVIYLSPLHSQYYISLLDSNLLRLFFFFPQTANSALLLFTPDPKDRIRQSVCPNDLMVFTPPL